MTTQVIQTGGTVKVVSTARGIASLLVDPFNNLIVTYDDGTTQDAGVIASGGGGTGGVNNVAVSPSGGILASVANPTTTPNISLSLGAITPTSVAASGTVNGSNLTGVNTGDQTTITGNAGSATKLQTARTINSVAFDGSANITLTANWPAARTLTYTGDVTGSLSVDGSANASTALTLATSGVTAGSYGSSTQIPVLTVDAKGRVTVASSVAVSGGGGGVSSVTGTAPIVSSGGTTPAISVNTFSSSASGVVPASGGGTTNFLRADGSWSPASGTGGGTVTSVSVATANGVSGSVANATSTPALTLTLGAITPSSVAATGTVTGSNLSGTNTGDQTSVTGNAGTATKLATARTINGVAFDGTANITINTGAAITDLEQGINFTAAADAYIPARVAMTIAQGNAPIGTGTISYAASTAAAPTTFTSTTLPVTLQAGAWLKVTASAVTGFVALDLYRTA